jgi:hypothetical protein
VKNQDPSEQLLSDIFAEAISPELRSGLLSNLLQHAQRKRRARNAAKAATASVVIALISILGRQTRIPKAEPKPPAFHLVETQPLSGSAIVTTRPFATKSVVVTVAFDAQVETKKTHLPFRVIDDHELLALAGEGRAALVRVGPHTQELIFVKPDDATEFRTH